MVYRVTLENLKTNDIMIWKTENKERAYTLLDNLACALNIANVRHCRITLDELPNENLPKGRDALKGILPGVTV